MRLGWARKALLACFNARLLAPRGDRGGKSSQFAEVCRQWQRAPDLNLLVAGWHCLDPALSFDHCHSRTKEGASGDDFDDPLARAILLTQVGQCLGQAATHLDRQGLEILWRQSNSPVLRLLCRRAMPQPGSAFCERKATKRARNPGRWVPSSHFRLLPGSLATAASMRQQLRMCVGRCFRSVDFDLHQGTRHPP